MKRKIRAELYAFKRELKECPHCKSIHSRLKSILVYNFKGVSTKCAATCGLKSKNRKDINGK